MLFTSFNWPLTSVLLSSTFGQNQWGHLLHGVEIRSAEDDTVYPIEDGELIYGWEKGRSLKEVPSGIGNFLVIEHQRRVRSLYGHLKPGFLPLREIQTDDRKPLGKMGNTGRTPEKSLYLEIIDGEIEQAVNPQLILGVLPDTVPPEIGRVYLRSQDSKIMLDTGGAAEEHLVPPGEYEVMAAMWDPDQNRSFSSPRGIFRVLFFVNGSERHALSFRAVKREGKKVSVVESNDLQYQQIYEKKFEINLGTVKLHRGELMLEIIVFDTAENETTRTFTLFVTE